jgi:hypothetical protein
MQRRDHLAREAGDPERAHPLVGVLTMPPDDAMSEA